MDTLGHDSSLSHSKIITLYILLYSLCWEPTISRVITLATETWPLELFSPSLKTSFEARDGQVNGPESQWHRCHPLVSATAVVSKGNNSYGRWSHLSLTGTRTCIRTLGPLREKKISHVKLMGITAGYYGLVNLLLSIQV